MKKIVKGNDFTMKIPVSKYDLDLLVNYSLPGCTDIEVSLISGLGKRYQLTYNIGVDDDYILYAHVTASEIPLGSYSLEVKGKKYGISWRSNEYEQILFVDYNKDGDTAFEPDEGDDSVEMNTAIVILARDDEQIHEAINKITDDMNSLKLDSSISPVNYYTKLQMNKIIGSIDSSISDISTNLNDASIKIDNVSTRLDDASTRLKNDYLTETETKSIINSSYIELDNKIKNIDVTDLLEPINNNITTLTLQTDNIETNVTNVSTKVNDISTRLGDVSTKVKDSSDKIDNVSTRLKNDFLKITTFNSSYLELDNKIKNIDTGDISEQLKPINNKITDLTKKTTNIDSSISDVSTRLNDTSKNISGKISDINTTLFNYDIRIKGNDGKISLTNVSVNDVSTRLNDVSSRVFTNSNNVTLLQSDNQQNKNKIGIISSNVDEVSTRLNDASTRLSNDYLKITTFNSSYLELDNKIKNIDKGSTNPDTPISSDVLKNYYTKDIIDDLSTDISTKLDSINNQIFTFNGVATGNSVKINETSTKLNDVSTRLYNSSTKIDDVSSKLYDVSVALNNSSTKLYDVSVKLDDVITKVNNGSGTTDNPGTTGGISVEQYLKDEKLIASTLNDLKNSITDNQDSITRQLNSKYHKLNEKILSETAKYLSLTQYSKDEKLIASTFNDLNNRISSLEKEIEELKNNKTN